MLQILSDNEKCETHNNNEKLYYSQCVYCILEGEEWFEESDSWEESTYRILDLVELGFNDYMEGITKKYTSKCKSDIRVFRDCYQLGQNMAEKLKK